MPLAIMTYLFCTAALYQGARFLRDNTAGRDGAKHIVAVVSFFAAVYLLHNAAALCAAPDRIVSTFQSTAGVAQCIASVAAAGVCWLAAHQRG